MSMMQGESDLVESREVMIWRDERGRLSTQQARMREAGGEAGALSSLQLPTLLRSWATTASISPREISCSEIKASTHERMNEIKMSYVCIYIKVNETILYCIFVHLRNPLQNLNVEN